MKKVDLHIHTVPTIKDSTFTFDINKMQLYVKTLELDAIAITNHNIFDKSQYEKIKEKLNITVFPGVEVDIENAHMIVITDEKNIDRLDEQCQQLEENMQNNKSYLSYDEFVKIFTNYEEYLLIPHYKKKPAVQTNILKKFGNNITCGEVDNIKKFCVLKKQIDDLVPILSSDVRIKKDLENFPTRFTFLDINDTSLKSIKYALKDRNKVFINESKNDNEFVFTPDGLVASTKLNVIIGKRSSGKTYTLNMIAKAFDTSDIKYIKQFEITEKSGQDKFEKLTKAEYERITNEYISPISNLLSIIFEINLDNDDAELENYHSSLMNRALNSERNDIFSKSSMFNQIKFDVKSNNELHELIEALQTLLNNETYKETIEENIDKESLKKLLLQFIEMYRNKYLDENLKNTIDKLIEKIQKRLELKSSIETISQIDFYDIMRNRLIVKRFRDDFDKIKKEQKIFEEDYQRFKVIATKVPYKTVTDMKKGANITSGALQDLFEKFYKTDLFKYVQQLKECGISTESISKSIIEVKYNVINDIGSEISGGEKAEFNLLKELDEAKNYDVLLLDEPEASFDNPYIKENINTLIKDISNKTTVFVVTHNSTLGVSNKANKLIYTEYNSEEQKYEVYVGNFTDSILESKDGKSISTYNAIVNCMEAGIDTYEERRKIYETIKM